VLIEKCCATRTSRCWALKQFSPFFLLKALVSSGDCHFFLYCQMLRAQCSGNEVRLLCLRKPVSVYIVQKPVFARVGVKTMVAFAGRTNLQAFQQDFPLRPQLNVSSCGVISALLHFKDQFYSGTSCVNSHQINYCVFFPFNFFALIVQMWSFNHDHTILQCVVQWSVLRSFALPL